MTMISLYMPLCQFFFSFCNIFDNAVNEFGKGTFFNLFFMAKLLTLLVIYKKKKIRSDLCNLQF